MRQGRGRTLQARLSHLWPCRQGGALCGDIRTRLVVTVPKHNPRHALAIARQAVDCFCMPGISGDGKGVKSVKKLVSARIHLNSG